MADDTTMPAPLNADLLVCSAEIVAAYLSRNTVGPAALPDLIRTVHGSLSGLSGAAAAAPREKQKPAVPISLGTAGLHCLPGRRDAAEDAEALPAHAVRAVAGRVSSQMGPAGRLSHGRASLCRATV